MEKMTPALHRKLGASPDSMVALIVRTDGDPARYLPRLAEMGFVVGHQFRLLPGVAVRGRARAALSLLDEAWVLRVEEDQPVTAM
ncbi:MAG: hypothetical protein NZ765_05310 [Anaerolineae bacterium]|nr:hypothetical protein [Anaerolineae bacterium]MDW8071696.1 hypothetical protein [Anaerolineae bacterium]